MRDLREVEKFLLPPAIVAVVDVCWWAAGLPWFSVVVGLSSVYILIDLTIGLLALYYFDRAYYHIKPTPPVEEVTDTDHPIFRYVPKIAEMVARAPLANYPTPITEMRLDLSDYSDSNNGRTSLPHELTIHVKREDLASNVYGGVKVRTLEFLIGCAKAAQMRKDPTVRPVVWTIGAPGSNHALACASFSEKAGIVPGFIAQTPQYSYSTSRVNLSSTLSLKGRVRCMFNLSWKFHFSRTMYSILRDGNSYVMTGGGANPVGSLGHVGAGLELAEQIERKECPEPTDLFVTFGSGCTTAGLCVGIVLARHFKIGFRRNLEDFTLHATVIHPDITRMVGTQLIKRIAHQSLDLLREAGIPDLRPELDAVLSRVIISTKYIGNGYGHPTWKGRQARKAFEKSANSPVLDTSYAEKGAARMLDFLRNEFKRSPESLRNRSVVFWASKSPVLPKGSVDVYERQLAEQPEFVREWLAQEDDPAVPARTR
jgi:1-aminocyclopropane-1-carboxylate deaminase/D-cysteine desulfhydrase-like pyridoxal-dependent ACC family enzyme